MDPTQLSAAEAGRAIADGSLSPVALTEAYLDRIEALDGELHSYVLVLRDEALNAARVAEQEIRGGRVRGPLHGVPIGLKDIYKTKGIRTPAGSSSGTAAAVGAHLCAAGMGSDTGGSIRGPAAFCGLIGLKPTYGRVSRRGVFPLSYTLDHCGPLTRTVEDCALMLQALAAYDPLDPASADAPVPDYSAALATRLDGMTIGVIRHWHEQDAVAGFGAESAPSPTYAAAFDTACRTLETLGARLVDLRVSPLIDFADANRIIMMAEAYALHESDFRERPHLFGRHMFARIGLGAFLSAADYIEAVRKRRELCVEMAGALTGIDAIVSANSTGPAPRIDAVGTYSTMERASYTAPYNITGLPAMSVPIGFENGLPLAFQIAGKPFDEAVVLRIGHAFEQTREFRLSRPPISASLPGRS
jgi:aspartyl-tRNA(Asn)/glutamyl-tRNA(Gln) amidotransferase subunit A